MELEGAHYHPQTAVDFIPTEAFNELEMDASKTANHDVSTPFRWPQIDPDFTLNLQPDAQKPDESDKLISFLIGTGIGVGLAIVLYLLYLKVTAQE